jgi:hypothetical protein
VSQRLNHIVQARPLQVLALCLAVQAPAWSAAPAGEVTRPVIKALEARDCAAAVRELNLALASSAPEALLLGGSMFEQGLCLKPNIERAARLYGRAAEVGAAGARSRLAALSASPAAGPDNGMAIWWGLRAGLPLPAPCRVPADQQTDADSFARVLGQWPTAQLDACVHVTGVLAAIDAEFGIVASATEADSIGVEFRPATGGLKTGFGQLQQEGADSRPQVGRGMAGDLRLEGSSREPSLAQAIALQREAGKRALADQVEKVGRDALARYPRPADVDAAWRIEFRVDANRSQ